MWRYRKEQSNTTLTFLFLRPAAGYIDDYTVPTSLLLVDKIIVVRINL